MTYKDRYLRAIDLLKRIRKSWDKPVWKEGETLESVMRGINLFLDEMDLADELEKDMEQNPEKYTKNEE